MPPRSCSAGGLKDLKFKLLNRNIPAAYTPGGVYSIDQWRRIGVTAEHEQLETKLYQERVAKGDFDVAVEFQADFMDDPTAAVLEVPDQEAVALGYSGHTIPRSTICTRSSGAP
jgi:peptide/nickel transport system substrate-binding protein